MPYLIKQCMAVRDLEDKLENKALLQSSAKKDTVFFGYIYGLFRWII